MIRILDVAIINHRSTTVKKLIQKQWNKQSTCSNQSDEWLHFCNKYLCCQYKLLSTEKFATVFRTAPLLPLHCYTVTNLCVPVATNTSRRYLRSATHGDLLVPRMRTMTYGPRSFAVSGPTVWNTLPSTLRVTTTTLGQFQSGLKTILFHLAYTGHY